MIDIQLDLSTMNPPVKCDPTSLTPQPQALSFFPLLTITSIEVMYSNKIKEKIKFLKM